MGPDARLWGLQSRRFGVLRLVLRFGPSPLDCTSETGYSVSDACIATRFGFTRHLRHTKVLFNIGCRLVL